MTTQNDRVQKNTPESLNREMEGQIKAQVAFYSKQDKNAISRRIAELEKEWNMDRMLITNASSLAGIGLLLGATVHKRWLFVPGVVLTFLLQHGIQGWCPPLPLFRKFGVRSFKEIDRERFALKFLRGDFSSISNSNGTTDIDELMQAINK